MGLKDKLRFLLPFDKGMADRRQRSRDEAGARLIWYSDQHLRSRLPTLLDHKNAKLSSLAQDGSLHLGASELDVSDCASDLRAKFDRLEAIEKGKQILFGRFPLLAYPSTSQALIESGAIDLVRAYLGNDARFDRAVAFRIVASADKPDISGLWHHDRCGHRLKVYLLLSDTPAEGRPTIYAPGTHMNQYYAYSYPESRIDLEKFELEAVPRALCGSAGDIIVFDTNGLHRASWADAPVGRDAIAFEFSNPAKSDALEKLGFPIGIKYDRLSKDIDLAGLCVDETRLSADSAKPYLEYGESAQFTSEPVIDLV